MSSLLQCPDISNFLAEELPFLPFNNGNTIASPHSCAHCEGIVIDLAPSDSDDIKVISPGYGLVKAISAARDGCLLYRAFLAEFDAHQHMRDKPDEALYEDGASLFKLLLTEGKVFLSAPSDPSLAYPFGTRATGHLVVCAFPGK